MRKGEKNTFSIPYDLSYIKHIEKRKWYSIRYFNLLKYAFKGKAGENCQGIEMEPSMRKNQR